MTESKLHKLIAYLSVKLLAPCRFLTTPNTGELNLKHQRHVPYQCPGD